MQDWPERERYTAEDLLQIIRILRDRENGCPWDKVQTHASIRKNFLEETCEALEAIDADDAAMMREELGDVLMQVAFHTVIEEERGRFDFEQVCRLSTERASISCPKAETADCRPALVENGTVVSRHHATALYA